MGSKKLSEKEFEKLRHLEKLSAIYAVLKQILELLEKEPKGGK